MADEVTRELLQRMQIITANITAIVNGDKEKDLDWQLGQMITTCENWSDQLARQEPAAA
jgi:hypothetical protein